MEHPDYREGTNYYETRKLAAQNAGNWSSSADDCIEMTLADGVYTADYESVDCGDGYSYFKLIKRYAGEEFSFEDFVAHDSREQAPAETRSIGGTPWEGHRVHHHQHTPVIHKGSPRK